MQILVSEQKRKGIIDLHTNSPTVTRFLDSGLSADDFNICLTSCTRVFVPRFNAPKINKLIKKHNFRKGQLYGIIATDYIDAQICKKIINTN